MESIRYDILAFICSSIMLVYTILVGIVIYFNNRRVRKITSRTYEVVEKCIGLCRITESRMNVLSKEIEDAYDHSAAAHEKVILYTPEKKKPKRQKKSDS